MKLKKSWIASYVFFILVVLFFGNVFIHTSLAWWFNVPILGTIPTGVGLIVSTGLLFIVSPVLYWIFYGGDAAYEEKVKMTLDRFEIHDYYNVITITLKETKFTWVLYKSRYRDLKVADLKYISGTNYFNRRGKFLTFTLDI